MTGYDLWTCAMLFNKSYLHIYWLKPAANVQKTSEVWFIPSCPGSPASNFTPLITFYSSSEIVQLKKIYYFVKLWLFTGCCVKVNMSPHRAWNPDVAMVMLIIGFEDSRLNFNVTLYGWKHGGPSSPLTLTSLVSKLRKCVDATQRRRLGNY